MPRAILNWKLFAVLLVHGCAHAGPAPLSSQPDAHAKQMDPGRRRPFPEVRLKQVDRGFASLTDALRGHVAVVDLWATWCEACERQHEVLERLATSYKDEGLVVVGVSIGEEASTVRRYIADHPYSFPVYLDPTFQLTDALSETELPVLFVVDVKGNVVHRTMELDSHALGIIKAQLGTARTAPLTDRP